MAPASSDLDRAIALLGDAQRVVVLTGAGISTASGIPDFRGPDGVWTKDPEAERLATISHYLSSTEVRARSWQRRAASGLWRAEPSAAHRALVDLEHGGRLELLVTQNIDGLHQRAGSDPGLVVEVHGNVREYVCLGCDDRGPIAPVIARLEAGEADPPCRRCGGILKVATVMFGQALVAEDLDRSFEAAASCDLLVAIGTSLTVHPVADLVPVAAAGGAEVVIVNGEPTGLDHLASALVRGDLERTVPSLVRGASGMTGLAE